MPDKDINIHVKAQDTAETKRKVDETTSSVYDLWKAVGGGAKQSGDDTDKTSQKLSGMGRIVDNLKNQVTGMVLAWISFTGVSRILDFFNQRLERSLQLSKEFYDKVIQLQQVGQGLEFQTGTTGQQRQWGMKALELQKAGGLGDIATAQALMSGAQKVYGAQGGLQNANIWNILIGMAPAIGASQMGPEGINSLFQIAEQAKVPPEKLNDLIAKIQAGAIAGRMTFQEFLGNTGTGAGFVNYLAGGGSLDKTISLYSAAGNVSANKRTGNSLLDLLTQISAGQNEEARKTVERFSGQSFKNLNMDQRADAVLNYINSLPEATRVQTLTKRGFPSAADLSKLASPGAQQVFESAQKTVSETTAKNIQPIIDAYLKSTAVQEQRTKINIEKQKASMPMAEQLWQNRLTAAKGQYEILVQKGKAPFFYSERGEETALAYQQIMNDAQQIMESSPKDSRQYREAEQLYWQVYNESQNIGGIQQFTPFSPEKIIGQMTPGKARRQYRHGVEFSRRLQQLQSAEPNEPNSVTIINNYDNSTIYPPPFDKGDIRRVDPNDL